MSVKQYTHPCRLTSPHEVSNRVRDIQWLLQGNNRFKGLAPYKDGEMDNEYGPLTAQAVRSAKKWLGYPASGQTNQFGQTVYEYLRKDDWRPLPTAFRERRDALPTTPTRRQDVAAPSSCAARGAGISSCSSRTGTSRSSTSGPTRQTVCSKTWAVTRATASAGPTAARLRSPNAAKAKSRHS
jgi:hypothetical protein